MTIFTSVVSVVSVCSEECEKRKKKKTSSGGKLQDLSFNHVPPHCTATIRLHLTEHPWSNTLREPPLTLPVSQFKPVGTKQSHITMADSPGSPLSSIASDDLTEDIKLDKDGQSPSASSMPPSKRRRTGLASWDHHTPISSVQGDNVPTSPSSPISSDTDGDIPNSPSLLALIGGGQDDDYSGQGGEQVSICRWDGCEAGDLGNMDNLVNHIHEDHIGSRQKKYSCEWVDCSRKGQTHASGYALRAHMRSHTREKPFYCALPGMSLNPPTPSTCC